MRKGFTRTVLASVLVAAGVTAGGMGAATPHPVSGMLCATGGCDLGVYGWNSNLTYHNGSIENGSTNYLLFIGWTGTTVNACVNTSPCEQVSELGPYESDVLQFFDDLRGSSLYKIVTQYNITAGTSVGGTYSDSAPVPPSNLTTPTTLTDYDLTQEINAAEINQNWTGGIGHNYLIFLGPGLKVCRAGVCSTDTDGFCSYHQTTLDWANRRTPYAVIPYQPESAPDCTTGYAPNGVPGVDDAINAASHEFFEIITDPDYGFNDLGWLDQYNDEIGDKCLRDFGSVDATGANITLNGDSYIVQEEYSNRISGCSLS